MKKMKEIRSKLMSLLLSATMIPAVLPMQSVGAAEEVKASNSELFVEDFEGYATGRLKVESGKVYDSAGKLIPGAYATIIGDDYLEIVEENGNKYLIIQTWRNGNENPRTYFGFNFGGDYKTGIKEVSYKYKSIMHRACYRRFGCVFYDETNPTEATMKHIWSQGATIITKIGEPLYGWNDELYGWQFNGKFGSVKQTMNYTKDVDNYEIAVDYVSNKNSKTFTVANLQNKPTKGINWGFSSYMSYGENGKEEPYTETYGRYAFDDITLKDIRLEVVSQSAENNGTIAGQNPFTLTFNENINAPAVTVKENGIAMQSSDYTVTTSGRTVSVVPVKGWAPKNTYEIAVGSISTDKGLTWAGETYTLTGSEYLFVEDFEGYATGRLTVTNQKVYDSNGKLIPGAYANIIGNDYLEIIEENGNKYLVIQTERNANENLRTYFGFNFGGDYKTGIKEVSYDYKSIMHRACYRRFGCVFYDDTNPTEATMKHIWSQGATIITKISEPLYGWNNELYGWQYNGKFGYVKQTMDYNKESDNYEIVMNYGSQTTAKTFTVSNLQNKPTKGINWGFSSSMSFGENGKEEPYTETYGRYAFDNVALKDRCLELESTNVENNDTISPENPFTLTFNENVLVPAVTVKENGVAMSSTDYTVTVSGKTVSIVPVKGWKGDAEYEITVGQVTAESGLTWNGGKYNLIGSKYLFIEDFEDYATGRLTVVDKKVYDSTGKLIPGAYAKIIGNDYLEIVEENGNKYLVIQTERNASENPRTYFGFDFGGDYKTGIKEVSYDYKSIMHRACYRRFGCVFYDDTNPTEATMKHIWSQGATVITKVSEPLYGWNNELYGWQYNGKFGYVKQTMDYNKESDNYEIVMNYGSQTTAKTFTVSDLKNKPTKGINWGFSSYMSFGENGKEEPYTETYGRYAFDNVALRNVKLLNLESSIVNGQKIAVDENVELSFNEELKDNVKDFISVAENGEALTKDKYTVSVSADNKTITIAPVGGEWKYDSQYTVTIGKLEGVDTENYAGSEISFKTEGFINLQNPTLTTSEDGTKSVITAKLYNDTLAGVTYQSIGVLKDKDGNILSVHYGNNGTLGADTNVDIIVEAAKNDKAEKFELYIWDGINTMKPLVKKK